MPALLANRCFVQASSQLLPSLCLTPHIVSMARDSYCVTTMSTKSRAEELGSEGQVDWWHQCCPRRLAHIIEPIVSDHVITPVRTGQDWSICCHSARAPLVYCRRTVDLPVLNPEPRHMAIYSLLLWVRLCRLSNPRSFYLFPSSHHRVPCTESSHPAHSSC